MGYNSSNLYDMGYNGSNLYDMGYNGSNLYDMGYNGSIIVLVFSISIFMTWGTTVPSLYLYFPHQSL
jgi:hypothetical protein